MWLLSRPACAVLASVSIAAIWPSVAHAQEADHQLIKQILEGATIPAGENRDVLGRPGARYKVYSAGCRTSVDGSLPSDYMKSKFELHWMDTKSQVIPSMPGFIAVGSPRLEKRVGLIFAGSPDRAVLLKGAFDRLSKSCVTGVPGVAVPTGQLVAAGGIAERKMIMSDVLHTPQCNFVRVPGLTLSDRSQPTSKGAWMRVPAKNRTAKQAAFGVNVHWTDKSTNWHGLLTTDPTFSMTDPALGQEKMARAEMSIDGRAFVVPVTIVQGPGFGTPFSTYVRLAPSYYSDQDKWFPILEGGREAVINLVGTSGRRYGPWAFDVSGFRNLAPAIKAANWTCAGAGQPIPFDRYSTRDE